MPVDSHHEEYDNNVGFWSRARHVLDGEDSVKNAGKSYLDALDGQNAQDYNEYKNRALFVGASDRTRRGFVGMIYRKDPVVIMGPNATGDKVVSQYEEFLKDADMTGNAFYSYSKNTTEEVLGVGRMGTLIDWNEDENRPYLSCYKAESIINWRQERIRGKMMTTLVVLQEMAEVPDKTDGFVVGYIPQLRVLKLVSAGPNGRMVYQVELWQKVDDDKKKQEWLLVGTLVPNRQGIPLHSIPFIFHGPRGGSPCVDKIPLNDVIICNLHHYRLSADYNHGLHFTALPTAWVAGFDPKSTLRIGSGVAWVSENFQAKAGFLEFTGQGLDPMKEALEKDEQYMAILGARMLESTKKAVETVETLRTRQSGETATLTEIAASVSVTLSSVLKWVFWWSTPEKAPEAIPDDKASIELNTEFLTEKMDGQQLTALVAAWIQRAISHKTLLHNMRQGEMLPPGVNDEDEQALIEAQPPPTILPPAGKTKPAAAAK